MTDTQTARRTILDSVTEIVSSHLANNAVAASEVGSFIRTIHATISELERVEFPGGEDASIDGIDAGDDDVDQISENPAVPIENSIHNDYIVCLEDGRRLRMLKRYLMTQYGMTPEEYRAKWGLPQDYPMVAPAVAEQRRVAARANGLGRKLGSSRSGAAKGFSLQAKKRV